MTFLIICELFARSFTVGGVFFVLARYIHPSSHRLKALVRHGIVAPLTKRIATKQSPKRKSKSDEKAAFLKCLYGIG